MQGKLEVYHHEILVRALNAARTKKQRRAVQREFTKAYLLTVEITKAELARRSGCNLNTLYNGIAGAKTGSSASGKEYQVSVPIDALNYISEMVGVDLLSGDDRNAPPGRKDEVNLDLLREIADHGAEAEHATLPATTLPGHAVPPRKKRGARRRITS